MRAHGNWCGPGWTAGQYKDASELTEEDRQVPAIDDLDERCKTHDIYLHDYPEKADEINNWFVNEVKGMGIKGALFALAVSVAGPTPQSNLQDTNNMPKLRPNANYYKLQKQREEAFDREQERKQEELINEDLEQQYMSLEDINAVRPVKRGGNFETPDTSNPKRQNISPNDYNPETKFPWKSLSKNAVSLSNLQQDTNMEVDTQVASRSASATSSSEGGRNIHSGETPILYATPCYQLPETHTVILPVTFYGSGILNSYQALDFIFRTNDFKQPLTTKLSSVTPATNQIGAPFTAGLFNRKIPQWSALVGNAAAASSITQTTPQNNYLKGDAPNATRWPLNEFVFPNSLTQNQQPLPKMSQWYIDQYNYYTTLSCEYEMIIENTQQGYFGNGDILVCTVDDTYSLGTPEKTNNRTGINQKLGDVIYWKNVQKDIIKSCSNQHPGSRYHVIKGVKKPGDGRRMVENDGDQQRWTLTSTTLEGTNKMLEEKHMMFFPHPDNTVHNRNCNAFTSDPTPVATTLPAKTSFNFQMTLKYIVQFKDLKANLREPIHDNVDTFALTYNELAQCANSTVN